MVALWNVAVWWGKDERCGGEGSCWLYGNVVVVGPATCFVLFRLSNFGVGTGGRHVLCEVVMVGREGVGLVLEALGSCYALRSLCDVLWLFYY